MDNEFVNRQGMFHTALDMLHEAQWKAVWENKQPQVFTLKVQAAADAVRDLDEFCRKHGSDLTGVAADKAREEKEAVNFTYSLARLMVQWFLDNEDETNAAKVDIPKRGFSSLRDIEEVNKLREVRDLGQAILDSDKATEAEDYGITAGAVAAVHKEVEEFAAVVTAPQASISQRRALTLQMRQKFNAVEAKFGSLDNLIQGFSGTPEGRDLIAAYTASRIVRDLGGRHETTTTSSNPEV